MNTIKYDGYIRGLYSYYADNNNILKVIFSKFFKIKMNNIKVSYRRDDLELMVTVKLENITTDALIIFTVNRLDEYRYNYDNNYLLDMILSYFKIGNRINKLNKIKNRIKK